jgi:hypothetical protein
VKFKAGFFYLLLPKCISSDEMCILSENGDRLFFSLYSERAVGT